MEVGSLKGFFFLVIFWIFNKVDSGFNKFHFFLTSFLKVNSL